MPFPYKLYETLAEPLQLYYPAGAETQARWVLQTLEQASELLAKLPTRPAPEMEILLVAKGDWESRPRQMPEEQAEVDGLGNLLPYWTGSTKPSSLVVPVAL